MRSYNSKIVYFNEHLKRLKRSSKLIAMRFPYPLNKLKELIKQAIGRSGFFDACIRLTLWKSNSGTNTLVMVRRYQPYSQQKYRQGLRICISPFRQNENSFLAKLKTTSHLFYQIAYKEARGKKFDEALILNNRGYLCEGSRSNIFLVKNKALFTPALECGCLDGITRQVILDLAKKYRILVYTGNFTIQDLSDSDEVFLTNSLIGVMPLEGKVGRITEFFMQKYNFLLSNGS